MKIIASLTTIPSRIEHIQSTLESIVNQTIPLHAIELNIPWIYKKTGEGYKIPTWLLELVESSKNTQCEIRIFRTEDYGSITKIQSTVERYRMQSDVYIWSVDDDFIYAPNMLAVLYRDFIPSNPYVLSHSCGHWIYRYKTDICVSYETYRTEGFKEFLEGFATVLYPASVFQDDFNDYIVKMCEVEDNRNSDDIIISNYLILNNIKIYNCSFPYYEGHYLLNFTQNSLPYGFTSDALHYQGGGNKERYLRVFKWLEDSGLNGWIKNREIGSIV